jgi:nitronate monooxygenase
MQASRAIQLLSGQLRFPIIQAPMAGISTPAMAAAVCSAGGLGSIGLGAETPEGARRMILATRELTSSAFNVNVFCHRPEPKNMALEASWIGRLRPEFAKFDAPAPASLSEIYKSFVVDDAMLRELVALKPRVVSFHFGAPGAKQLEALRGAGSTLIATATSLQEAELLARAGMDAVVAQGYEAGGHRGMFDQNARDDCLGTIALTRLLVRKLELPVIAAGGIMDGAAVNAALRLGAIAAQLGTAFIACPESAADAGYRAALASDATLHTVMTSAISGRPARSLANRFTALGLSVPANEIPPYPFAYAAGKALHAAAKARSEYGYGAHWAGQGAPLARPLPAAKLMSTLAEEMTAAAH